MNAITLADVTLEDLLPHRAGLLLVTQILEVDSIHAQALFLVQESWPMADRHGVHPLIMVELAAQTAGVCNGWDRIKTLGLHSDQMGWLVGIKKAEFFIDSLPFGGVVTARAENTYSFEKLREVSCDLHLADQLIGKIILQLFQAAEQ